MEIVESNTNELRKLSIDMHHKTGACHVSVNLSCLDIIKTIFHDVKKENDSFVLSKGHAAGALYLILYSIGKIKKEELYTFHQDDTNLPGHPPINKFKDILFATGSLGHGLSLAVGTALANKFENNNNKVYCLTGDGEWQSGAMWEALIFAIKNKLHNLTILIDHNQLQGFGNLSEVTNKHIDEMFKGFDVCTYKVNGHQPLYIKEILDLPTNKVKIVVCDTIKGKGVSFMENKFEWHYKSISDEEFKLAMEELQ